MSDKKAARKPGVPEKRRGQQMGDERSPLAKMGEEKKNTPALRGRRKNANKMFADESSQHIGADAATPSSNSPSTPAFHATGEPQGQSGGEKVFKQRQTARRSTKR